MFQVRNCTLTVGIRGEKPEDRKGDADRIFSMIFCYFNWNTCVFHFSEWEKFYTKVEKSFLIFSKILRLCCFFDILGQSRLWLTRCTHVDLLLQKERLVKSKSFYLMLIVLFIIVTGLGCAALHPGLERPRVNIAHVTPNEIKPFEQVFDLELRIQNRNDSELVINGLIFDLEINDKPLATGISNQTLTISRLCSDVIHAQATTSTWDMLRQILEAQRTGLARVKYRLRGKIFAVSPDVKFPFDETGEIDIPFERPKQ